MKIKQNFQIPHLVNYGGKVLKNPKLAPIFYGSYWSSSKGKLDQKYLSKFSKDIPKSKYMGTLSEYGVGKGKGLKADTVAKKIRKVTFNDKDIQSIVKNELRAKKVAAEDGQTIYTVFLPPNAGFTRA